MKGALDKFSGPSSTSTPPAHKIAFLCTLCVKCASRLNRYFRYYFLFSMFKGMLNSMWYNLNEDNKLFVDSVCYVFWNISAVEEILRRNVSDLILVGFYWRTFFFEYLSLEYSSVDEGVCLDIAIALETIRNFLEIYNYV